MTAEGDGEGDRERRDSERMGVLYALFCVVGQWPVCRTLYLLGGARTLILRVSVGHLT